MKWRGGREFIRGGRKGRVQVKECMEVKISQTTTQKFSHAFFSVPVRKIKINETQDRNSLPSCFPLFIFSFFLPDILYMPPFYSFIYLFVCFLFLLSSDTLRERELKLFSSCKSSTALEFFLLTDFSKLCPTMLILICPNLRVCWRHPAQSHLAASFFFLFFSNPWEWLSVFSFGNKWGTSSAARTDKEEWMEWSLSKKKKKEKEKVERQAPKYVQIGSLSLSSPIFIIATSKKGRFAAKIESRLGRSYLWWSRLPWKWAGGVLLCRAGILEAESPSRTSWESSETAAILGKNINTSFKKEKEKKVAYMQLA